MSDQDIQQWSQHLILFMIDKHISLQPSKDISIEDIKKELIQYEWNKLYTEHPSLLPDNINSSIKNKHKSI